MARAMEWKSGMKDELIALLPRLRRFAFGLCWSQDQADDLVQAACERALRAEAQWQRGTRLDAWLFQIIRNLWIDEVRKRQTRGVEIDVVDTPLVGDDGAQTVETRLYAQAAWQALAQLPEEQREVMLLVCVEETPYREAADILGVPIGTVMSRLARARKRLAEALASDAPMMRAGERP